MSCPLVFLCVVVSMVVYMLIMFRRNNRAGAKGEADRWRELYGSEDDRLHLPSNGPTTHVLCQTCGGMWLVDDEEEHAPGCEA